MILLPVKEGVPFCVYADGETSYLRVLRSLIHKTWYTAQLKVEVVDVLRREDEGRTEQDLGAVDYLKLA